MLFSDSGFWNFQIDRYYNRRLIRTMIRQYLIVYNFQHDIDNTKAIHKFNEILGDPVASERGSDLKRNFCLLHSNKQSQDYDVRILSIYNYCSITRNERGGNNKTFFLE